MNDLSKTSWEEDDAPSSKRSSWDFPTPSSFKSADWSERSNRRKNDDSERSHKKPDKLDIKSERATPAYKFNNWVKDRRKTGATPGVGSEYGKLKWNSEEDKQMWEEEQRRIDREWYNIDEGTSTATTLLLKHVDMVVYFYRL